MKIEKASIIDAEIIADINIKVWKTTYCNILSNDTLTKRENQRQLIIETIQNLIKTNTYLIAKVDDVPIDFILYGDLREISNLESKKTGEVYAIYILENYQRKGIGKKLIDYAIKDLISKDYKNLLIWGLKDNPCTKFYEKIGGIKMHTRKISIFDDKLLENSYYFDDIKTILLNV